MTAAVTGATGFLGSALEEGMKLTAAWYYKQHYL